jgi:transcriptional regulator with XRE-family HTH domain
VEDVRRANELLRRARVLRGWSQQRVADHINQLLGAARADRELVDRWEAGKRTPSPFYRERLCQVFTMTAEELGLVELPTADLAHAARKVAGESASGPADIAAESPLPESLKMLVRELWRDEVNRRAVLQFLGALAAGTALEGVPLKRAPIAPVAHAREVADYLTRAFPELSTADWLLGPHHILGTVGGHLVGLCQVGARACRW